MRPGASDAATVPELMRHIGEEALDMNIELAAPDDCIPPLPDRWQRSVFVARHGQVDFLHYDFCVDIPSFRRRVEVTVETAGRVS